MQAVFDFDSSVLTRAKIIPVWVWCSLVGNGILLLTLVMMILGEQNPTADPGLSAALTMTEFQLDSTPENQELEVPALGPRHRWTYEQWVTQLGREAMAMAENRPQRLTILAGDSLTLWFPNDLLPPDRTWLNQGISGEVSQGLLKRLYLFDQVQAETIFVMIGINDLIRGTDDQTILENYYKIIQDLRWVHPQAEIVLQSILPHSGQEATWEGRDRLLEIPNQRIRGLNQQLKAMANSMEIYYLDLHPLFTDRKGNLRQELTTDGLHLNEQGYLVWRSALQLFSQMELK